MLFTQRKEMEIQELALREKIKVWEVQKTELEQENMRNKYDLLLAQITQDKNEMGQIESEIEHQKNSLTSLNTESALSSEQLAGKKEQLAQEQRVCLLRLCRLHF